MFYTVNNPSQKNLYLKTATDKNGNYAQIKVKKEDVVDMVQNEWGLHTLPLTNNIGGQPVSCELMSSYLKALNGILPDGLKYDLKIPKSHNDMQNTQYRIFGNEDGTKLAIDKIQGTETEEVLNIGY